MMIFCGFLDSEQIQSLMSRAEYIKKNIKVSISHIDKLSLTDCVELICMDQSTFGR